MAIRDKEPNPLPDYISDNMIKLVTNLLKKNPDERPDTKTILKIKEI